MEKKYEKYVDESWKESAAQEKERLDAHDSQLQAKRSAEVPAGEQNKPQTQSKAPTQDEHYHDHGHDHDHPSEEELADPQINFLNYLSSLGYQAMIFLGQIPHPATNQTEKNLEQAKYVIDTLAMLRTKTKGNLSKQEEDLLNATLYELQMRYVELVGAASTQG